MDWPIYNFEKIRQKRKMMKIEQKKTNLLIKENNSLWLQGANLWPCPRLELGWLGKKPNTINLQRQIVKVNFLSPSSPGLVI